MKYGKDAEQELYRRAAENLSMALKVPKPTRPGTPEPSADERTAVETIAEIVGGNFAPVTILRALRKHGTSDKATLALMEGDVGEPVLDGTPLWKQEDDQTASGTS